MKKLLITAMLAALPALGGLYNGTQFGTPTFAAGHFSNAMTSSPSNYYTLPSGVFGQITSSSDWTVNAWLKTTSTSTLVAISSGNSADADVFWFGALSNGHFAASVVGTGAFTGGAALDSTITINDGSWHHCEFVMVGGTTVRLFVDGVLGGTFSGQITAPTHSSGFLGGFSNNQSLNWAGSIDEAASWDVALHTSGFTAQVAIYDGTEANLRALYHLESGGTDSKVIPVTKIYADNANIVYSGRWAQTGSGATAAATTINAGAYFDIAVNGTTSLQLTFDATGLDSTNGYPDILYCVDGGSPARATLASGAGMSVLVGSIPVASQSAHRIRVYAEGITEGGSPSLNQWTGQQAALIFRDLTIDSGGVSLPIPVSKNTIEFLGDSLTASVRQLGNPGGSTSTAIYMAGHNSYAMQTANALGLRAVIVGFGGTGVTVAGSGSVPIANTSFPLIFSGTSYTPTIKPIAVVINQGTNDGGASGATFRTAYTTYLATIRAAYPLAMIFCLGVPSNTHSADVSTVVTAVADPRIFYLDYTALSLATTDGVHYSTEGATILAAKLSSDIQTQLNASGVTFAQPGGAFIFAQ